MMSKKSKTRNSSIELLRILLMTMIVMHHVVSSVIALAFSSHSWACFDVFLHTAVVVFVLISGYFGIRFSWKRLFSLVLQVIFYSILLFVVVGIIKGSWDGWFFAFLPFSNNYYWFVTVYLQLYLVSFFLNKLFDYCSEREFLMLLGVMAFFVFYLGFLRKNEICDDGKNLVNFIFLYQVGYGIRSFNTKFVVIKTPIFVSLIVMIAIIVLCFFIPDNHNLFIHSVVFLYKYNSPFLILLSVILLLVFLNIKMQSKMINYLASSSFSIYLIHEHPLFREFAYVRPFHHMMESGIDGFTLLGFVLLFAITMSLACMLVDKFRVYLFSSIIKVYHKRPLKK